MRTIELRSGRIQAHCRAKSRWPAQQGGKTLTGMPKTDFSAWLTSPLAIVKVGARDRCNNERKRGDGEVSRRTPEMGRKKKEKRRRGGRGKKKILLVRGNKRPQETNAQSGRAGRVFTEMTAYRLVSCRELPTPKNSAFGQISISRTALWNYAAILEPFELLLSAYTSSIFCPLVLSPAAARKGLQNRRSRSNGNGQALGDGTDWVRRIFPRPMPGLHAHRGQPPFFPATESPM